MLIKEVRPGAGLEAAHCNPVHRLHHYSLGSDRARGALGGWVPGCSSCLPGASCCQPGWSVDDLFEVVIRLHRVYDGLDPPLADGALGLALSPPQDAVVTEAVEARHHVGGIIPAVQAHWAAVPHLCGHALHPLQSAGGAGDDKMLPLTGDAAAGVLLEKEERPQSLAGLGRGGRSAQVPQEGNPPSCPG